jgi:hypothetical protein
VVDFWLNPVTGAMLALASNDVAGNSETLSSSNDPGSRWTTLTAPPFIFTGAAIFVQQPFTDQSWHICASRLNFMGRDDSQGTSTADSFVCTRDGGAHWTTTQMNQPVNLGCESDAGPCYTLVGIADDGAVLLTTSTGLERIVPGVTGVQSLGPAPNPGDMIYVDGSGAGALWSIPASDSTAAPPGRIYTAQYV